MPTPIEKRTSKYWPLLNQIIDPEMGIGLVDLGLIYEINIDPEGLATILMTLTSPACPVGPVLVEQVKDKIILQPEIIDCNVQIVWEPMWTNEMIDPEILELMGL